MHFDALTLASISTELRQKLLPGRVQQVLLVDDQRIGLEIYASQQRQYLLISASPTDARIHLVTNKLRRGPDAQPPLLLLLRKYVRNAILDTIHQPDPTERVLRLGFEHAEHGSTTLIVELIGRMSNLILTGPGDRILDCVRRVRGDGAGGRNLWPGATYMPPPTQGKLSPLPTPDAKATAELTLLLQQGGRLWRLLVDGVAGISPTLAREIAWRTAGNSQVDAAEVDGARLKEVLNSLWAPIYTNQWEPGVVTDQEQVIGFAPYMLHFTGHFEPTSSMSQAVERLHGADHSSVATGTPQSQKADPYAAQRNSVAAVIRKVRKRLERNLTALQAEEPAPDEAARLRVEAEWLLALSSQIAEGQRQLTIDLGEEQMVITLEQDKTAVQQADGMFKRAAKLERAAEFIPQRRGLLQTDLDFLAQLESDLRFAENQPEIGAVEEELLRAGLVVNRKRTKPSTAQSTAQPLRYLSPDGVAILVGRNARQNEMVTFKMAGPDELWLHAHGAPGAHVVVRTGGQSVSEETLRMAAQLAGYHSGLRGEKAAPISVTTRRFVTRVPGGRTGQVYVRNADTITVPAELPAAVFVSPSKQQER